MIIIYLDMHIIHDEKMMMRKQSAATIAFYIYIYIYIMIPIHVEDPDSLYFRRFFAAHRRSDKKLARSRDGFKIETKKKGSESWSVT